LGVCIPTVRIKAPSRIFDKLLGTSYRHLLLPPSRKMPQKVRGYGKEGYKLRTPDLKKAEAGRHPQGEIISPLEASLDHLLVTPPSHCCPQMVEGLVV